ncbi:MAG: glycoside hydrolase family 27 protein, partial [Candidatus Neomarinimicrobiota bacterium]
MKKNGWLVIFLLCVPLMAQKFDKMALTPPMGWNSWNRFGCDVNEQLIRETADAMVSSGMKAAGYQYVVI